MFEYFKDLVDQLKQVPGGPSVLLRDYFAKAVAESLTDLGPVQGALHSQGRQLDVVDAWVLQDGATLCLAAMAADKAQLLWLPAGLAEVTPIVELPGVLLKAAQVREDEPASGYQVSPLVLTLLAIAMGGIDDRKRLAQVAPEVDYCAKGLLLIASCRLCG